MTVPFVRAILTEILVFLCFKITFSMSNWPHKQILWRGFDPFTFAIVKSAPFDINKSTKWCWFVFTARCTFVSVKYAFFIHVLSSNNEQKFASALYSNNTFAASRLSLRWFFMVFTSYLDTGQSISLLRKVPIEILPRKRHITWVMTSLTLHS